MRTRRTLLATLGLVALLSVTVAATAGVAFLVLLLSLVVLDLPPLLVPFGLVPVWGAYAVASTQFGQILLRFGGRAFPLMASGRRQPFVLLVLWLLLGIIVTAGITAIVLLALYIKSPLTQEQLIGAQPIDGGMDLAARLILAVFRAVGWALLKLGAFYLATLSGGLILAVAVPLRLLIRAHRQPRAWRRSPYVLFLRTFRGTSNSAAMGPLARGLPSGVRLALLSPPFSQASSWDPMSLGLSGFDIRRPFSSAPIRLLSDDASWLNDVRDLASGAEATVIDVSNRTLAVEQEIAILNDLPPDHPIVWLARHDVALDASIETVPSQRVARTLEAAASSLRIVVRYREALLPGLIRRLFVGAILFIPIELIGLFLVQVMTDQDPTANRAVLAPVTLLAVTIAAVAAIVIAAGRGYTQRAAGDVRAAVDRIFTGNSDDGFRSPAWREFVRRPAILTASTVLVVGGWLFPEVLIELDTLEREDAHVIELQAARDRLARFPLIRGHANSLLAAQWENRALAEKQPDGRLALNLKAAAIADFSSVNRSIASLSSALSTGALTMTYRQGRVTSATFTPDRQRVFVVGTLTSPSLVGWENEVVGKPVARLWNTFTGTPATREHELPGVWEMRQADPRTSALSPDGTYAAVAAKEFVRLIYFDSDTWFDIPGSEIGPLAISADSRSVAIAMWSPRSFSQRVRVFRRSGQWVTDFNEEISKPTMLRFDPSGHMVITGDQQSVALWNAETGARVASHVVEGARLVDVAFAPDGRVLVAIENAGGSGEVRQLSPARLTTVDDPFPAPGGIASIAVSPDGVLLAVGSRSTQAPAALAIWRLDTHQAVCQVKSPVTAPVSSLVFDARSKRLAVKDEQGLRVSGDWRNGSPGNVPLCLYSAAHATAVVDAVAGFTADEQFVLTTGDSARLWRTAVLEHADAKRASERPPSLDSWLLRTGYRLDDWALVPRFGPK